MYRVTGPNNFSMDVMIEGNKSVTVKGLTAGTYTVTELNAWSWRYKDTTAQQTSAAAAVNGTATVNFTNSRETSIWLSGDSFNKNLWVTGGIQSSFSAR